MNPDETHLEFLERHRATARKIALREKRELAERYRTAWELVYQARDLLREHYRAARVVVFGSLLDETRFTPWSDVDIAVWGLKPEDTFYAINRILMLSESITINLVDVEMCKPNILEEIDREGREI